MTDVISGNWQSSAIHTPAPSEHDAGRSRSPLDHTTWQEGAADLLQTCASDEWERSEMEARTALATHVKHIPRVNLATSFWEPHMSSDRRRLLTRLDMYGLCERVVKGDGSCQFRALSDQLYRTPHMHDVIRRAVVAQLRSHPGLYECYVPGDYSQYCRNMAKPGVWGDHVTLQAAADALGLRISVLTSFHDSCFIEIGPQGGLRSQRVLYLSFWAEVHYNSLYPAQEPPTEPPMHKLLGSRRLYRMLRSE